MHMIQQEVLLDARSVLQDTVKWKIIINYTDHYRYEICVAIIRNLQTILHL